MNIPLEYRGLAVLVFNAVGAMPTDRGPLGRRVLEAAAEQDADLLIGVECDDLEPDDVREILGPAWWFRHRQGEHRDGAFLAGRRERTSCSKVASIPGAPASPVNAPREILKARITVDRRSLGEWKMTVAGLHVPRWREGGGPAAEAMVRKSRTIGADLLGGDFNIRRAEMLERYPLRQVRGDEVMHLVANPMRVQLSAARAIDLVPGTQADDHPGVRSVARPAA